MPLSLVSCIKSAHEAVALCNVKLILKGWHNYWHSVQKYEHVDYHSSDNVLKSVNRFKDFRRQKAEV